MDGLTREVPGEPELGTINIENAITVEQAIYGFTLGGVRALGYNYAEVFGSIEVGKSADMVVLDRNILEIDKNKIHLTQVEKTVFRGRVVFNRAEEMKMLDIIEIEITNKDLDNAIDAAELNYLIEDDIAGGHRCFVYDQEINPGAASATDEVNKAFASLAGKGYDFLRPARSSTLESR